VNQHIRPRFPETIDFQEHAGVFAACNDGFRASNMFGKVLDRPIVLGKRNGLLQKKVERLLKNG
jgi:hypothetical protein